MAWARSRIPFPGRHAKWSDRQRGRREVSKILDYKPQYTGSHALVIGINKYKHTNPLAYAANDASAVAAVLVDKFGFPEKNVTLLLDAKATKTAISQAYLQFVNDEVIDCNDRILVKPFPVAV